MRPCVWGVEIFGFANDITLEVCGESIEEVKFTAAHSIAVVDKLKEAEIGSLQAVYSRKRKLLAIAGSSIPTGMMARLKAQYYLSTATVVIWEVSIGNVPKGGKCVPSRVTRCALCHQRYETYLHSYCGGCRMLQNKRHKRHT